MTSDPRPADSSITPLLAIAAFFFVFGTVVLSAVLWTEEPEGRVVNLACGVVFLAVGLAFAWAHRRSRR